MAAKTTSKRKATKPQGLYQRHGRACKRPKTGCKCPWQAFVYSPADGKKIRKLFPSKGAAKSWRDDAQGQVRRKVLRAPTSQTLTQAAEQLLAGMKSGLIITRSKEPYKPATIRSYGDVLRLRVLPELGHRKISDVTLDELQDFVDKIRTEGLGAKRIEGTMLPLRVIYGRALKRSDSGVTVNPTTGLELPKAGGPRERVADPDECSRLLGALASSDRPLWATAMYAGLRRGELQALRIENIDLEAGRHGMIHVLHGWDPIEGEIPTKNRRRRRVPILKCLRPYLDPHLQGLPWSERPDGLVFGVEPRKPFAPSSNERRAKSAWGWKWIPNPEGGSPKKIRVPSRPDPLEPIAMHECRHTYVALLIAAKVDLYTIAQLIGDTVTVVEKTYAHLLEGAEQRAGEELDTYLDMANTGARLAQIDANLETGTNPGTRDIELAL